jgi:ParB/RepB/Spo0J family partition protein
MNERIKKTPITVEHHCLDLVYASTRLQQRGSFHQLMLSIEQHGQLVPVVIVAKAPQQWVLIDGYLRVKALRHLGKDTIIAEVWNCEISQALLALLAEHQSRPFEAIEEALLLRELQVQDGLSQGAIASAVGRERTWVCRRLALIEHMPEAMLQAVLKGTLSLWAAQRILVPVARATPAHAEKLLVYLLKNHASTRELQSFYEYYQRAHHQERAKMVNDPGLFFKAQKLIRVEKKSKNLRAGPEGKWQSMLSWVSTNLKQIIELTPQALYPHQESQERQQLLNVFYQAKLQFDLLTKKLEEIVDVNKGNTRSDSGIASERKRLSNHQPTS